MTNLSHEAINADPKELAKFAALAHQWWDPVGEFRPLHDMNPVRLDWIQRQVALRDKTVLDVGCGGGILSESMAAAGAGVLGIDLASAVLRVARLHALESGLERIDYREVSAEQLAEASPQTFDVVTCMEMLEHVPDPLAIVRACAKLVKPNGWVFFSTINRSLTSFLGAIVAAEYVLKMLPRGTHEYAKFIKPSELASYCRDAGLTVQEIRGMNYNPWNRRYSIGPKPSVDYLFATRKLASLGADV